MEPVTQQLELLGKTVAKVSDEQARVGETLFRARCRTFGTPPPVASANRRVWGTLAAVTAATALAAGVWIYVRSRPPAMSPIVTYQLAGNSTAAAPSFFETKHNDLEVRFSEGSVITVLPETGVRVLDTKPQGVNLSIERGIVRCNIRHRANTDWTVKAGPFDIRVTGTRFEAEWVPTTSHFELTLEEGSVEVTGPHVSGTQRVVKGERFTVEVNRGEKSLVGLGLVPAPSAQVTSVELPVAQPDIAEPIVRSATVDWSTLAKAGKYREALSIVDRLGFDVVLQRSDAATARLLADASRMGGKPKQAQQAFLFLRERLHVKAETAFVLGKISADQLNTPAQAYRWFDTYLREQPKGPLREQALGRSLELSKYAPRNQLLANAREYLTAFPSGAHAPLARKTLGQTTDAR